MHFKVADSFDNDRLSSPLGAPSREETASSRHSHKVLTMLTPLLKSNDESALLEVLLTHVQENHYKEKYW